jgi:hypothetical protein
MKLFLCATFIFLGFTTFANCKPSKSDTAIWMRYDETKCANPWQFNWFAPPTDEQLAGAVRGHLQEREVKILDIRTKRDTSMLSCEACTCPNGFHYYVRIPKSDIPKLKALNFQETKEIPAAPGNNRE